MGRGVRLGVRLTAVFWINNNTARFFCPPPLLRAAATNPSLLLFSRGIVNFIEGMFAAKPARTVVP